MKLQFAVLSVGVALAACSLAAHSPLTSVTTRSAERPTDVAVVVDDSGLGLMVGTPELSAGVTNQSRERLRPPGKNALELSLSADRSSYRLDEVMILEMRLVNRSVEPLFVYRHLNHEGYDDGFWLVGRDALTGKSVPPSFVEEWGNYRTGKIKEEDLIRLDPNYMFGTRHSYPVRRPMANIEIDAPGTYDLSAGYEAPRGLERLKLPIWTRDHGIVWSNKVRITVTE